MKSKIYWIPQKKTKQKMPDWTYFYQSIPSILVAEWSGSLSSKSFSNCQAAKMTMQYIGFFGVCFLGFILVWVCIYFFLIYGFCFCMLWGFCCSVFFFLDFIGEKGESGITLTEVHMCFFDLFFLHPPTPTPTISFFELLSSPWYLKSCIPKISMAILRQAFNRWLRTMSQE